MGSYEMRRQSATPAIGTRERKEVADLLVTIVARASRPGDVQHTTLRAVLERFRRPSEHLQALIGRIRGGRSEEERKALKRELAQVVFSGTFERRQSDAIRSYAGILTVDLDADQNPGRDLPAAKPLLASDPYVLAAFVSPSGHGLKLLVRVAEPIPEVSDPKPLQKAHARAARAFFGYLQATYGLIADQGCTDLARACFATVDPELHFNPDAGIFRFRHEVELPPAATAGRGSVDLELIESALAALPLDGSLDYHLWLKVLFALASAVGEDAAVELMLKHTKDARDAEDYIRQRLKSYRGEVGIGTLFWLAGQFGWRPPGKQAVAAERPQHEQETRRSAIDRLIEYARADFELFHAPEGMAYLRTADGLCYRLASAQGRSLLARAFYKREGKGASSSAISEALPTLEAIARFDGPCHPVFVRVARDGDRIYLDLGGDTARAVEIDAEGWRVRPITELPVRFERPPGTRPLPEPVRGGDWNVLRELLNTDRAGFILATAWLVGALAGLPAFPVLVFTGPQGSGKSTACRLLASLIDPRQAPLNSVPKELRDLAIYAQGAHVLAFDNLSALPQWLSDGLCRLATGNGFRTRRLYTDSDEVVFEAVRPIVANGIPDFVRQPDLADRTLPVRLALMPPERRRTAEEVEAAFREAAPGLLGLLLDAVSTGLRRKAEVQPASLPRMADFATFVLAAAPALPFTEAEFLEAYGAGQAELAASLLEDSFAEALLAFAEAVGCWEGTASDLLEAMLQRGQHERPPRGWPKTAQSVGSTLARLEPVMLQVGVKLERVRAGKARTRLIRIQKVANQTSALSALSANGKNGSKQQNLADSAAPAGGQVADDLFNSCPPVVRHRSPEIGQNRPFSKGRTTADEADNLFETFWDGAGAGVADRPETAEGDNDGWWDPFEDDEDEAPF